MAKQAELILPDKRVKLPIVVGSENEHAVDITKLRSESGYVTLDSGYGNTGSCESEITYIDGEKGILRYRGYPIEELAEHSTFIETAWLVIFGELPTLEELALFSSQLQDHAMLHEGLRHHFEGFPPGAPPMAMLSTMINATGCYHPELMEVDDEKYEESFFEAVVKLISKVRTIAAFSYKKSVGEPIRYPDPERDYVSNFLHMMFSRPYESYEPLPEVVRAMNLFLILHTDHEQNCSTSTVRMVASGRANLFASVSAGVSALWGSLHGGANVAVLQMLRDIRDNHGDASAYIAKAKDKKSDVKLMGFGHRVYRNFDPRAKILKEAADKVLARLGVDDPLLDIAMHLEEAALEDEYFIERKLYPNVDFYSGIILRAIGIPTNMFTVLFAMGRMPGWISNWHEVHLSNSRIYRPRQIYTGVTQREFVKREDRG